MQVNTRMNNFLNYFYSNRFFVSIKYLMIFLKVARLLLYFFEINQKGNLMLDPIVISDAQTAVALLDLLLQVDDTDTLDVEFQGWPIYSLNVVGDRYHTSVTPSMMQALLNLQSGLYRAAATTIYNDSNIRKLTVEQRAQFEYILTIHEGSTDGKSDWSDIFQNIMQASVAKMNGRQVLIALIVAGLCFTGHYSYQNYLEANEKIDVRAKDVEKLEITSEAQVKIAELNKEQIEMLVDANSKALELIEKAVTKYPQLKTIRADANNTHSEMLKKTANAEKVSINGLTLTSEEIQGIISTERGRSNQTKFTATARILAIDTTDDASTKVRARVGNEELIATYVDDSFDLRAIDFLQKHLISREPLKLTMEGRKLNGKFHGSRILAINGIGAKSLPKKDGESS